MIGLVLVTHGRLAEELVGAAHAGCFSMALSAQLGERQAFEPGRDGQQCQLGLLGGIPDQLDRAHRGAATARVQRPRAGRWAPFEDRKSVV